jgi:putative ABC transport system permease protein
VFQTGDLAFGPDPVVYVLYRQNTWSRFSVLVRSEELHSVPGQLRAELAKLDPDLAFFSIQTVDELHRTALAAPRLLGILFGLFAVMALVMSSIGLYGVTAHGVNQRTQEIGIRVALGATPVGVVSLFLKQAMKRVAVGTVLGLVGATYLTDAIGSVIVINQTDTGTFVATVAFLTIVSLTASLIPAWRASRLNPVDALRTE